MRYLLAIALVFSFIGFANADGIPTVVDPKAQPTVWTQTVYANAAITSGYVVEWDFDTCTTTDWVDMCMWVKLCDTEDDVWTAGVVPQGSNVTAGTVFDMIIRGPAFVKKVAGATCTAGIIVGSTATGTVEDEGSTGGDDGLVGVSIKNVAFATRSDLGNDICIIWVDPTLSNK